MTNQDLLNEKTYDLVFWTSIQKHTELLIPLINEVFNEHFPDSAEVRLLPGKQATRKEDGSIEEGEMDALAEVIDPSKESSGRKYHFEMESKGGNTIAIRLAEYGAAYAYESVTWNGTSAEMTIPHAAVIFLRSNATTPDNFPITIHYPGGQATYDAPAIKMRDYTIDAIFRKKLLLLLPFFPFLFEDRFEGIDKGERGFEELKAAMDDVNDRLNELSDAGEMDEVQKQHMLDWLKHVFDKLTIKYKKVQEGVDQIMTGYMLHTRTDDILDQGIQQGMQQGVQQERKESAIRMKEDGLSIDKIAQYVGENIETVGRVPSKSGLSHI